MDFFELTGRMALGSRLRRLSETITEDAWKLYELYGVELEPRWFPVFFALMEHQQLGVTEMAQFIGHSHASVSQIVKEMKKSQLVQEVKDEADGRKTLISLTPKGMAQVPKLRLQIKDISNAMDELFSQMQYDLWKSLEEVEYLLKQKNLFDRVNSQKKGRDSQQVEILNYTPDHQEDFKRLNVEWIERYFRLEQKDLESLNDPQASILDKGGHILLARYEDAIVGVVALLKLDDSTYELAKMAVSPQAQGKSIGFMLGTAIIQKARELGAKKVFLESNTLLKPAIQLYHKLGFQKIVSQPSAYERSNIQMELLLASD
jgi:DNA-binding MarR family transcriptional regulator